MALSPEMTAKLRAIQNGLQKKGISAAHEPDDGEAPIKPTIVPQRWECLSCSDPLPVGERFCGECRVVIDRAKNFRRSHGQST